MDIIINRRNDLGATIEGLDENVLAGYSGRLILASEAGGNIILTKQGVIANPANPIVEFAILPADLAGQVPGVYLLEVDVWKPLDLAYFYTPISERVSLKPAAGSVP